MALIRRNGVIRYSDVPPPQSGDPYAAEWATFYREMEHLLAGGNEGRCVLIREDEVIGVYNDRAEAMVEGYRRFPDRKFLAPIVREWLPAFRIA